MMKSMLFIMLQHSDMLPEGTTRSSQEQPEAARGSQEQPGAARSTQEQPEAARGNQEQHP